MRHSGPSCALLAISALLAFAAPARALDWRTYVSGTGDDLNACTMDFPCRTFAKALTLTLRGGEIAVVGGGRFAAVAIGQPVTIDGGGQAGTTIQAVGGGTAVDISAGPSDMVTLRNLTVSGGKASNSGGATGVRFTAGGGLHLDNVRVEGFTGHGLDFEPVGASKLQIENSGFYDNGDTGIFVKPGTGSSSAGSAAVTLIGAVSSRNKVGLSAQSRTVTNVRDSTFNENTANGVVLAATGFGKMTLERCLVSHNAGNGVTASGAGAYALFSESSIVANGKGLNSVGGGQLVSFGTNRMGANVVDGAFTSSISQQ